MLCMIMFALNATGCSNSGKTQREEQTNNNVNSQQIYVMETNDEAAIVPTIQLNEEDNTFSFTHDVLSSVIIGRTYEIQAGILSAKADNGNQYLFEVVDKDTLIFIQDGSAKIELIDDGIDVTVTDKAVFKLKE